MELLKYLDNNTLFIIPESYKEKLLLNNNKLCRVKYMTLKEFINNFKFKYEKEAIYYLMNKYDYKYDIAKMYLDNIIYIKNIEDFKIQNLNKIKKELVDNKLLIENPYFKNYLKENKVVISGYVLNKFENDLINELKKITEVLIVEDEIMEKNLNVYEFDTIEDEITYVAIKVIENINDKKEVTIVNITDEYINEIKRIFKFFNIPINIENKSLIGNIEVTKFINKLKETNNIEISLKEINEMNILNEIINICNEYRFTDKCDKYILECIINDIKNKTQKKQGLINIKTIDDYIDKDEFVYLIGFNQNNLPRIYKDEDYLDDKLRVKLNLDTSITNNQLEKQKLINFINKSNNIKITYKLKTPYNIFYKSSLVDEYKMNIIRPNMSEKYKYSRLYNELEHSKYMDQLIKYNEENKDLKFLSNIIYNNNYLTYNNKFTGIDKEKFIDYINNKILLSYSSMDNYYRCGFRYYLDNVLKLSKYEETYFTFIGNLFHYILSIAFKDNFNFEKEFNDYVKDKKFDAKEMFFINKLKEDLKIVIDTIEKQNKYSKFNKELTEEKIYINKSTDITFMGIVDKIKYYESAEKTLVAIIDYKTGTPNIDLTNSIYGIGMQLPIYIYMTKNMNKIKNVEVVGFYLQKIVNKKLNRDITKDYETEKQKQLKLEGYSIDNEKYLELFDETYKDSEVIKSLKTSKNGFYAYSKILNRENIDLLEKLASDKIDEASKDILEAKFDINPKRIGNTLKGCEFCKYNEICYKKEKDVINLKEYNDLSFLRK